MPRQPNLKYTCLQCDETVERYVRPIRVQSYGSPKYCSPECAGIANKGKPRRSKVTFEIQCSNCDVTFFRSASHSKGERDYCSRECQKKALTSPEGTRRQERLGYWHIRVDGHPNAKAASGGLWILEHRLIKERQLLRDDPSSEFLLDGYLDPKCHIHHKNSTPSDNREENLEAMWPSDHQRLQKGNFRGEGNTDTHRKCTQCHQIKPREEFVKSRSMAGGTYHMCRPCNAKRLKDARLKKKQIAI